jgi:predicted glycosyltransferase
MKIWFDICHPPHVSFFVPQIRELNRLGYETVITVRDRFQVGELCDLAGLNYCKVGRDYGKKKISKVIGLLIRAMQLYWFARKRNISIAVSQGSSYQVLAAFLLKIPSIFMTDYEHIFFGIAKLLATKIIMPKIIPDEALTRIGIKLNRVIRYPGFKEDVYLENFRPDSLFLEKLNLNSKKIIVTLRSPAINAHYHNQQGEHLFSEVIKYLLKKPGVTVVFLPRSIKEKEKIQQHYDCKDEQIVIPPRAINGLDLIWHSDLVISGGGTMNREAAVLGVPVYTIFKGSIGAVDQFLGETGRLKFMDTVFDVQKILIEKRKPVDLQLSFKRNLKVFLVKEIISAASNSAGTKT